MVLFHIKRSFWLAYLNFTIMVVLIKTGANMSAYRNKTNNVLYNESTINSLNSNTQLQIYTSHESHTERQQLAELRRRRALPGVPEIFGFRIEGDDDEKEQKDSVPYVTNDKEFTIRVFGANIEKFTIITLTKYKGNYGDSCLFPAILLFAPKSATTREAVYTLRAPKEESEYYFCAKNDRNYAAAGNYSAVQVLVHMGTATATTIGVSKQLLPLWLTIILIGVLLTLSALFSGLNLGMMALDPTELKIVSNIGSEAESRYAKQIWPVRKNGNFLLCSILLGNVCVNSSLTILIESISTGLIAVITSTAIIVLLGEIMPQAICNRHALYIGAKTIIITKSIMAITSPLSYPISKVLDFWLGEEIGKVYDRERLREMVRLSGEDGHNELDKTEVNIISGALEMRTKTVGEIMTPLEDCFLLSINSVLDFATVSEIMRAGYSRIPVYENDHKNIVTILFIKDLAFVDTDDEMPLRALCNFYQHKVLYVDENVTINVIFNQFRLGEFGHLAVVQTHKEHIDDKETVGIVTLEDVIEELLQQEIVDETDILMDNRSKIRRPNRKGHEFLFFASKASDMIQLSPQLTLVTLQYLSSSVPQFHKSLVSETVLKRLLHQNVVRQIHVRQKDDPNDRSLFLYEYGKQSDAFIVIIEGHVQIEFGEEKMQFESGPFHYFGSQVLENVSLETSVDKKHDLFISNYSIKAITDVTYLSITRHLYRIALRATKLEYSSSASTADYDNDLKDFFTKSSSVGSRPASMVRDDDRNSFNPHQRKSDTNTNPDKDDNNDNNNDSENNNNTNNNNNNNNNNSNQHDPNPNKGNT